MHFKFAFTYPSLGRVSDPGLESPPQPNSKSESKEKKEKEGEEIKRKWKQLQGLVCTVLGGLGLKLLHFRSHASILAKERYKANLVQHCIINGFGTWTLRNRAHNARSLLQVICCCFGETSSNPSE